MAVQHFGQVRDEDARYYRDYVERTHWLKLRSFYRALDRSGADISRLDGSSDSLVPLWQWVRAGLRVNFSFLEEEGPSSAWRALGVQWDLPKARRTLVNEWLGHYVFEQLHSIDRDTRWAFKERAKRGPQEFSVQQTIIKFRLHEVEVQNAFLGAFEMSERSVPVWAGDDALYRWATNWLFNGSSPVPTSPTFMERAGDIAGVDGPPRRLRAADAPEADEVSLGGIYYVAQWPDGEPDLYTAKPLTVRKVADALVRGSYSSAADERRSISLGDVADGVQALSADRGVIIEPLWFEGKLRGLEVRLFVVSPNEHAEMLDRLQGLAADMGARVIAKELLN